MLDRTSHRSRRSARPVSLALFSLFIAGVFAAPRSAAADTVSVSPSDSIQGLVDVYPAGSTFVLRAGVYRLDAPVRPKDGDVFMGEAGAVVSGARTLTSFGRSGGYWTVSGQNQHAPEQGECRPAYQGCRYGEQLFIDGQLLVHVTSLAEVRPGTWFLDYNAHVIYFADDPSGRTVETSVVQSAFSGSAQNVTVTGLVIERFANPAQRGAVDSNGYGWQVTGNEIRWNHGTGVSVTSGSQVRGNQLHHNGDVGVSGGGDSVLIENNEIAYNNTANFEPNWEGGGTKFVATTNLVVRGNYVHHNGGPGLWTDTDNINTLYENNTTEDNELTGILHEISYDAVIRGNVSRRNGFGNPAWIWGGGIVVSSSTNVEVANNLVEDNAGGIGAGQQVRGSGAYGPHEINNLWVHDNSIRFTQGLTGLAVDTGDMSVFTSRNNRFNRNAYQLGSAVYYFAWMNAARSEATWHAYGLDTDAYTGSAAAGNGGGQTSGYLSDRPWASATTGYGPIERDTSNGEEFAGDGRAITLNGVTYAKGFGVHADSRIDFALGAACTSMTAVVGVDDEVGSNGSVLFQVFVDGAEKFNSGAMTGDMPGARFTIDVTGGYDLALVMTDSGDGSNYDHGDWADAQVTCTK